MMIKMAKKDKKLIALLDDCQSLKDKKKYKESIRKYREALNYIRNKVKDEQEQKKELDDIKLEIDLIYTLEIKDIISYANKLVEQKKFNNAFEEFSKALASTYNITDTRLREKESNKINKLKGQTDIKVLIEQGKTLTEEKQFDDAIKTLTKALNDTDKVYDSIFGDNIIKTIKNTMNRVYSEKIQLLINQGTELEQNGHFDEAIDTLEKALKVADEMFDSEQKNSEMAELKDLINKIYSNTAQPLIQSGKQFVEQNQIEKASLELKKGISIINKMYDSEQKKNEVQNVGGIINPIYAEQIKPIAEAGEQLIEQEDFEHSIQIIDDAIKKFSQALEIAKKMVESEQKSEELKLIENLINNTCLRGIKPRREKGIQLIEQKKFDEAIRELYSVISIAKNMIIPEGQENVELSNVKKLINKVYSAEITDIIEAGNSLIELNKFDEAIEIFNNALNVTNKMYLSDEMDDEVNKIKNSIYQTELKQIISKGNLSDKQVKLNTEIKELSQLLENAKIIKEPDLKSQEMERIKLEIDHVHVQEINLLIEQGHDLAHQSKFDSAFDFFEKSMTIVDLIDSREIKNRELTNIINMYKHELNSKAKQDLNNDQVDNAIKYCNKAIELDDYYAESYYNLGNSYKIKKEHDKAIENYKKAVELDVNHANAWNDMGLVHAYKQDFDNAIESYKTAIGIDLKHANACYNMGNAYKHKKEFDDAIDSYKKAVEIDPNHAKAWLFMGSSYYDKKNYDKAIECIEKGIELNPELGEEMNSIIFDFKKSKDLLREKLLEAFKREL